MTQLSRTIVLCVLFAIAWPMTAHAQARRTFPNSPDVIEITDPKQLLQHIRAQSGAKAVLVVVFQPKDLASFQELVARVNRDQHYSVFWAPVFASRLDVQKVGDAGKLPKPYCACEPALLNGVFRLPGVPTVYVLDPAGSITYTRVGYGDPSWKFHSDPAVSGERVEYSLGPAGSLLATRLWASSARFATEADRLRRDLYLALAERGARSAGRGSSAPMADPEVLTNLEGYIDIGGTKMTVYLSGETRADGLVVTALRPR